MNKARMTIKFDHESSNRLENRSLKEQMQEYQQINSNEIQNLKEIKVQPFIEVLDKQQLIELEHDSDHRGGLRVNGRLAEESYPHDYGYYRSRKPASVWKVAGSITGAIITGILFGTVVLSMFNSENTDEVLSVASNHNESPSSVPTPNESRNDFTNIQDKSALAASAVAIPEQTFYMLQYGVFSSAERAEEAKGELIESGIAAFVGDSTVDNRVYAGVSPDREQAKLLSIQLKNEGVELYVREVTLPGAQSAVFAGEAAKLDIFFEISGELVKELSSLSASLLGKESPGPVDTNAMNTITGLHLQWTEAVKMISSGLSPETERNLSLMEQEMNSSITALTEFNKNQSRGHLWEIQEAMMKYIMEQRNLVESVKS